MPDATRKNSITFSDDVLNTFAPELRQPANAQDATVGKKSAPKEKTAVQKESTSSTAGAFIRTIGRIPENLAASALTLALEDPSVTNPKLGQKFVNMVNERNKAMAEEYADAGDFIPGVISKQDVAQLGPNLAFSGVSMAGSVAGAALGSLVAPGVGTAAGMAGGGLAAYKMASYQALNDWLTKKNEESIAHFGRPISQEEEKAFKAVFNDLAMESGLWEAGPEAVGNALEIALMAGKGTLPGKIAALLPKGLPGKVIKGAGRAAGIVGTEGTTETITQMGQHNVEVEAGMTGEPPRQWTSGDDWLKSAREVLPQVLLLSGVMSAGGAVYRKTTSGRDEAKTYRNIAKQTALEEDIIQWKDQGLSDTDIADRVSARLVEYRTKTLPEINAQLADGQKMPEIPDNIDPAKMVSSVLGPQPKPPGKVSRAKDTVLRSMGMKPKTAAAAAPDMPLTTSTMESKTVVTEAPRQQEIDKRQEEEAIARGRDTQAKIKTTYEAIVTAKLNENAELETARAAEEKRRNEETARIAAQEQASRNAAVANAQAEQSALIDALAGDDPKRQAIVNDVLGLSDRVLISSLQKELKLTVMPAGPGVFSLETADGPQPANLYDLRRRLAEKRVADQIARDEKADADAEALRRSEEEAAVKKYQKRLADALEMSRRSLYTSLSGPTQEQKAILSANRDQLTPEDIRRLDRFTGNAQQGTDVKIPLNPPLPKGETEGVVISEKENKDTSGVRRKASDDKAPDETAMIDLMLSDLDNAAKGGELITDGAGDTTRTNAGIPWLTSANAQGAKMDVNDARTVLAKAKKGETLTDRQQKMLEAILAAMRKLGGDQFTQALAWAEQGFIPVDNKKIPVRDMVEGDRYVVDNEEFGVTDIDDDGNVTLKDGTIKKLKDGEVLSGVDFVKPVEGAEDFSGEAFDGQEQDEGPKAQKNKGTKAEEQKASIPQSVAMTTGLKAKTLRDTQVPVPEKVFDMVGVEQGKVFADYEALRKKHPDQFASAADVKTHVEYVMDNPAGFLPATDKRYTMLYRSNGADKVTIVEFSLKGGKYRVQSAYTLDKGQLEIKKQKAQRGVSEPSPANPTHQAPLTQGGGVPSDTLHVEPLNDIVTPKDESVKIPDSVAVTTGLKKKGTEAKTTPAVSGTPASGGQPAFGASNTLFTEDKAAKARAILKAKLSGTQLNAGIDPEILTAGIDLAGFYIEGGARKFGDFSAKMVADIGEAIRPYLKSLYLAVRNYPGFDKTGMETEADLERAEENRLTPAASASKIPNQGGKSDADQTDVQSGRTSDDDQTPAATGEEGQNAGGLPEDIQPVISELESKTRSEGSEVPEGLDLRAEIEAHVEQYLYHATYEDKIAGINADGLDPAKSGQYIYGNDTTRRVYLSPDQDLALNFGDVLLRVKRDRLTATMLKDIERAGGKEVWYFDRIPPALIEHLTPKGEWAPLATQKAAARPASVALTTGIKTSKTKEDPYRAAVGLITGGRADRAIDRGYVFAYGPADAATQSEMTGIFSGLAADKLIEAGITIERKTPAAFRKGDRVVMKNGRHGEIIADESYTMTTATIFGGQREVTRYEHYRVRSDAGAEFGMIKPEDLAAETEKPAGPVVPDIREPNGVFETPDRVLYHITLARRDEQRERAIAQRARKTANINAALSAAEQHKHRGDELRRAYDAWSAQYPEEAAKYAQAKTPPPASVSATTGLPAAAPSPQPSPVKGEGGSTLAAFGLSVAKGSTNTGKTVWNVSGPETRTWKDTIKQAGGRWYGPKKVWSFYNGDPTQALLSALPPIDQVHPSIREKYAAKPEQDSGLRRNDEPVKPPEQTANEKLAAELSALRNDLDRKGAGYSGNVSYKIVAADTGLVDDYGYERTEHGTRTTHNGAGKMHWERARAIDEAVADAQSSLTEYKESAPEKKPELPGPTLEQDLSDRTLAASLKYLNPEVNDDRHMLILLADKADEKLGGIINEYLDSGRKLTQDEADFINHFDKNKTAEEILKRAYDEGFIARPKPIDNEKTNDYNKIEEEAKHAASDRHDSDEIPAANDRAGLEGPGPGNVSGTEAVGPADGVRPGTKRSDDGHVRHPVLRTEQGPVRHESDLSGTSPAPDFRAEPGVGRNPGDVADVQRTATGERTDHVIAPGAIDRTGSWFTTAQTNLDIIELAKKIQKENRPATSAEQALLARYTGFGASEIANRMFPGWAQYGKINMHAVDPRWKPLVERMQAVLTPEEIATAARSTQYAHYTSPAVIESIYKAIAAFGFTGGRVLEPGMGVGSFFGLMPEAMRKATRYTGIEMDGITAQIAKLLYPRQNIIEGDYTKSKFPNNYFDLSVGNPPFARSMILTDPDYKKLRLSLHDFFFVKSLDKIRPGGLMVFITSRYTMDKVDSRVRKILNEKADLLGAIRLPQTAFQHNAGTEVVTDVLFLRKKVPGEQSAGMMWGEVSPVATPEGEFRINEYYHAHPEMVLGNHSGRGKMQNTRDPQYTVLPGEGNIEEAFAAAAANLPKDVYSLAKAAPAQVEAAAIEKDFNPTNKKEGGLYLSPNGQVMVTESGAGVPVAALAPKLTDKDKRWLTSYITLRDAVKKCQYDQLTDGDWEASLKELTRVYRAFKMAWGRINAFTITEHKDTDEDGNPVTTQSRKFAHSRLLRLDVESPLVMALEKVGEDGQITDAPFLTERTIKKPEPPQIHTAADALAVSLNEKGKLDLAHVASLLGASEADIYEQLGDLVYDTPDKGIITADEYLSGNVVQKLEEAKAAAAIDPKYERNVKALIDAQPKPLTARDITASPGASWIPLPVYNDFAHEVLDLPDFAEVEHSPIDNQWTLSGISAQSQRGRASEWCTPDRGANEIFTAVLNNATQKVYKTEIVAGEKKTFLDPAATAQVNDIAKKMKARFRNWIWENAARAHDVLDIYNTTRNNIVPRRFDGAHLTLPGVSLRFKLMPHQKSAIWRIIQDGNTYIAHAVGAGKTYEMVAAGMEMKRLGLIAKPLYVVPNHMLRQFSNEFQELYPMAHIMVADEENFHTTNRRRFMAQAALNAPDAIVITHSAFGLLKMKPENIKPVRDAVIDEMREALDDLEDDKKANRIRIKQMEARIEQTEQRFDAMIAQGDNVLTFEDMGADFLFVDEAHQFRKLDFTTNRQAKGVDPTGSVRAMMLYIKTQWLNKQNPGRSHVFASGTPVTNTMGELYTIMKFFNLAGLQHDGMDFFDSWAAEYGDMASVPEMNAAGRYEIVDRFSRFVNVPELMSRVRSFMDVLTSSQLGAFVNRPKVQGGQPTIVVTPPSAALKNYQKNVLLPRIEGSKAWKPSPQEPGNPDPLINIITDGRLASIDMRFVQPKTANDPDSKLNQYIDKIIAVYKETKDNTYRDPATGQDSPVKGGAQICFYNHGFGKGVAARRGFDARAWAMQRFKEAGIPAHEIAWIDDYDTAAKKEAMMKEVRNGHKRILIGSAKKMGTGMNVQTRLSHMTYLDPPWYPSDVEQPVGRILRQGNQNKEVGIYYFSTKGSYDATMWQMVTRKAKFIEDALAGGGARAIEDISESSLYEMAAALASGDERAIRLAGLNNEIENLQNLRSAHYATQTNLRHEKRMYEIGHPGKRAHVANLEKATEKVPFDLRYLSGHSPIEAKLDARNYTDRKTFGQDLLARIVALRNAGTEGKTSVGSFFGLPLRVVQVMGGKQDVWSREEHDKQVTWVKENKDGKLVNQLQLVVTDDVIYDVASDITDTSDALGLVTRMTNRAKAVASDLAQAKQSLEETETALKKINARLGAPFEMERELEEKIAEAAQINADLARESLATAKPPAPPATTPAPAVPDDETKLSVEKLLPQEMTTDELEGYIQSRYEANAPQDELDALEDEFATRISEQDWNYSEDDPNVSEGISVEEQLALDYDHYLNLNNPVYRGVHTLEELLGHMKAVVQDAGGRQNLTDENLLAAAKDAYESRKKHLDRYKSRMKSQTMLPISKADADAALDEMVRDLATRLKGITIIERNGEIWIKTPSGDEVRIKSAEAIDPNGVALTIEQHYSKEKLAGKRIAGMFTSNSGEKTIHLVRDVAGIWTLSHEFFHFLENINAITNADKELLNHKIAYLIKTRPDTFGHLASRSLPEQRAEYVGRALVGTYDAVTPVGKILARIREMIDRVLNALGIRTAAGVIRDIQTGKIYKKQAQQFTGSTVQTGRDSRQDIDNDRERAYTYPEGDENEKSSISDSGFDGESNRPSSGRDAALRYQPTVVGREKKGAIPATGRIVRTPHDAAKIAAQYLNKYPDEHMISLVLGPRGRVIHVYHHTIGLPGQSQASLPIIAGEALNTPGAASVIMAHNHPSQNASFSPEDRAFARQLNNLLTGSGVTMKDFLAVAQGQYSSYSEDSLVYVDENVKQSGDKAKVHIPIVGRIFETVRSPRLKVSAAADALPLARQYIPDGGTLILDGQNALAGFSTIQNYGRIRGDAQRTMLQEIEKRNARAMIVYAPGRIIGTAEADNLAKFIGATSGQVRLLDIIDSSGSHADNGDMPSIPVADSGVFLSVAEDVTAKAVDAVEKKMSRAVDVLTGRVSPEKRETLSAFKKSWAEFWRPFSTVKDGDAILSRRYESMGNVAKAMRFVQSVQEELAQLPDAIKKDIFYYLNGDVPRDILPESIEIDIPQKPGTIGQVKNTITGIIKNETIIPPSSGVMKTVHPRALADNLHRRTEIIGEMLVDRGLLTEETFEKHKGKYVHYLYAKHIVGEDAPVGITSSGKLDLSYTLQRNPNLTMQQRKELGLIDDASVAVPVGMGKALTDIAKFDYLDTIADNPDWVWQPSVVRVAVGKKLATPIMGRTRHYVRMGIGKLQEQVRTYDEMMRVRPTPEVAEIHKILAEAWQKEQAKTQNAPAVFVQLPNTRGYGPLAGAFVKKPIADDLRPVMDVMTDRGKLLNTIVEIERQGMAAFKMGKVALNIPTAVRNIFSNIIQNNMRGRALAKIPGDIVAACESMKAKDAYYEEAFGMGLFNTNWFVTEINDVLAEFRKAESGRIDKILTAVKNVAKYYGKIDDISKHAIFVQMRTAGAPVDKAALTAMKWGMDYSLTSRSIKGLRQTIMPFACVDEKTEILTKRGWLRHDEVRNTDVALSFDLSDSQLKWKFISDVYRAHYQGTMLHFQNRQLDMMLTPDHKCIVYRDKRKNFKTTKGYTLKYAHSLNTNDSIPVAGKYCQFPTQSRYSDALVQIVAWIVTEGHYKNNTAQVCITQNKGCNADSIASALNREFPGKYSIQENGNKRLTFHLHADPGRHIRYLLPDKQLTTEFVLSLTHPQLELLVNTMIAGDGSRNHKRWQFIQKENQTLESFQLALVLLGISHGYCKHGNNCKSITSRSIANYGLRRTKPMPVEYNGIIWCPSVPGTGTWVARRNGRVFLTGNTYQYKIAPLIAESLRKRPWVLAKFALIYPAAKMLAMALHDLDDDDWDDLQKQLPSYIKKSGSMMILPWKTNKDQWQWVNLEYFFPFGNMLAIFRDARELDTGEALRDLGISNPFLSMFYTGLSSREDAPPVSSYSGFPIYNQLDPAPMKAAKYLEYMANTWMPRMATRQGAAGYTGKAIAGTGIMGDWVKKNFGGEDRWGREVSFGQALGRWFGFNIVSVSPDQSRAQVSVKVQDLRRDMARIDADPSRSEDNKEAYRARMNQELADIAQNAPAAVLPITKAKGADPVYEALKDMAARGILRTGPPARSVEVSGVPLTMSMEQYREYLDRSSDMARRKLAALVVSPAWESMPDARKTEVVAGIVANARKAVRQKIKAQMARDNREKILEARRAGR